MSNELNEINSLKNKLFESKSAIEDAANSDLDYLSPPAKHLIILFQAVENILERLETLEKKPPL